MLQRQTDAIMYSYVRTTFLIVVRPSLRKRMPRPRPACDSPPFEHLQNWGNSHGGCSRARASRPAHQALHCSEGNRCALAMHPRRRSEREAGVCVAASTARRRSLRCPQVEDPLVEPFLQWTPGLLRLCVLTARLAAALDAECQEQHWFAQACVARGRWSSSKLASRA